MIDPRDLPYTENPGPVSRADVVLTLVVTAGMIAAKAFGYGSYHWLACALPLVGLGGVMTLYRVIRNAVHEATRLADADHFLDEQVTAAVQQARANTLTPLTVSNKIREMSE